MISIQFQAIANHLWQSTLFAAAAGLLVVAFRRYGPQVRYGLWLAASAKFLVPFSILSTAGSWFGRRAELPIAAPVSFTIQQVNEPFTVDLLPSPASANAATHPIEWVSMAVWGIWVFGSLCIVIRWVRGMRQIRTALHDASPLEPAAEAPVMVSAAILEPSVVGVFRPVLLLPEGIDAHLTPLQLKSVLLHEIAHVRRRDNLTGLIHSAVEVLFWFHPLVWWMGARLSDERERACDEEVLRSGIDAEAYADGILRVCELYLKSPLPFVTGVTGSNLKKRIETIMIRRIAPRLNFARKTVLAVAGFVALASPFAIGIVSVPILTAQQTTAVWTPASDAPKDLLTAHEGERHDRFIDRARAGNLDIVFFGTTDTEMWLWRDRGRSVWDQTFGSLKAASFGSQGTRFDSLLWRMKNGELDGYQAKMVVLQGFGTGDQLIGGHEPEFVAGYTAIIAEIRARQPQAKILLSAPFPRGQLRREAWRDVAETNALVYARIADDKTVFYMDIGDRFFRSDGSHNSEMWTMSWPPNAGIQQPAFKVWAEELQPWVNRFVR